MHSIFNGIYLAMFIGFLRSMCRKLVPGRVDTTLPKYLIIAAFPDKGVLYGYSDSYDVCQKFDAESNYKMSFSIFTGTGYTDVDKLKDPGGRVSRCWDKGNENKLISPEEFYPEIQSMFSDGIDPDVELGKRYGFDMEKIKYLARRFRTGNYA